MLFMRLRKVAKVIICFMSGHPSFRMEQVGSQWAHFRETSYWLCLLKYVEKFQKISGTFYEELSMFVISRGINPGMRKFPGENY
jgi:hypothetical protein